MIFVSVGTQLPFDRLLRNVDTWAAGNSETVIAQAGKTSYSSKRIEIRPFIATVEYDHLFSKADIIIAHAGMGAILGAIYAGKPIVIMPRQAALGEHRNDHQEVTANRFSSTPSVFVAQDSNALNHMLDQLLLQSKIGQPVETANSSTIGESPLGRELRSWLEKRDSKITSSPGHVSKRSIQRI